MYAVIRSGGKQYRVEQGQQIEVDRVGAPDGDVELTPVMIVDGATIKATPEELSGAKVTAKVVDHHRGPKIRGFTYKNKSNNRRRWGHRSELATLEITAISG